MCEVLQLIPEITLGPYTPRATSGSGEPEDFSDIEISREPSVLLGVAPYVIEFEPNIDEPGEWLWTRTTAHWCWACSKQAARTMSGIEVNDETTATTRLAPWLRLLEARLSLSRQDVQGHMAGQLRYLVDGLLSATVRSQRMAGRISPYRFPTTLLGVPDPAIPRLPSLFSLQQMERPLDERQWMMTEETLPQGSIRLCAAYILNADSVLPILHRNDIARMLRPENYSEISLVSERTLDFTDEIDLQPQSGGVEEVDTSEDG